VVNSVNQSPTLNALGNLVINQNAGAQTVNLSGIGSGMSNEVQTLTVTAASSNPALIQTPAVNYVSPNASGSIIFAPVAGAFGTATITVTVNDGAPSNNIVSRSFSVTVNRAPAITSVANRVIAVGTLATSFAFTVSDPETSAGSLTVTATSSNPALVPTSGLALSGSGANRTVLVTPVTGATGYSTIGLTVSDGYATATTSFVLGVQPRPNAPTGLRVVSIQ
jgi:hypothetical protein